MSVASVRGLLAHFQGTGEFLDTFDPLVMAEAIRAAIDSVASLLARDHGFDAGHHAHELANLFVRAASPAEGDSVAHRQSLEE